MIYHHQPVLLKEAIQFLNLKPQGIYLDATLGDGGHTLAILKKKAKVIALDQDPEAINRSLSNIQAACPSIKISLDAKAPVTTLGSSDCLLIKANFAQLSEIIKLKVDGILFDLGVSTLQILKPERGFTFQSSGPLDMRMDPDLAVTAADLLKALSQKELTRLIYELGDEPYASKIAQKIVYTRQREPITSTSQLANLISRIKPYSKMHPATKTFQALRIAVNQERDSLRTALPAAIDLLKPNGNLVVISFHSGEDKIVKQFFKDRESVDQIKILTSKPIRPTEKEITINIRARSAKLRAATKK